MAKKKIEEGGYMQALAGRPLKGKILQDTTEQLNPDQIKAQVGLDVLGRNLKRKTNPNAPPIEEPSEDQ